MWKLQICLSIFRRRLWITFSCRCQIEEGKSTASAVSVTDDSVDGFGSESVVADKFREVFENTGRDFHHPRAVSDSGESGYDTPGTRRSHLEINQGVYS